MKSMLGVSWLVTVLLIYAGPAHSATPAVPVDATAAGRFAALALKCVHQEYPNKIAHTLAGDADVRPPRELFPAFQGCYDWHSAVHGHWLLARLVRQFPYAAFAPAARAALAQSLTRGNIAGEVAYLQDRPRVVRAALWTRLAPAAIPPELRSWKDPQAQEWARNLVPLESEAAARIKRWLPIYYPIRVGEHDQTAFSFGLIWDWAGVAGDAEMRRLLADATRRFYATDRSCPLSYEPSGQDFLSPCLAEADFMRRVLDRARIHALADSLPAGNPQECARRVAADGDRDQSFRSKARASRWPEPESCVDAGRNRVRPGAFGQSRRGVGRCCAAPSRGRTAAGDGRTLRGRTLARYVRGLFSHWIRSRHEPVGARLAEIAR